METSTETFSGGTTAQLDYNDTNNATNSDEIDNNNNRSSAHNVAIGVALIILQSILSVLQDLFRREEVRMTPYGPRNLLESIFYSQSLNSYLLFPAN